MAKANISTKQAIDEINKLIDAFNRLVTSTGEVATVSKGNFKKTEQALAALKLMTDQATSAVNKMTEAQRQDLAATRARTKSVIEVTDAMKKEANAIQDVIDKQKGSSTAITGLTGRVKDLIVAFGIANGIQIFANLAKNAYSLMKTFDSIGFALRTIEKDLFMVAESQRFLLEITQDYGVELVSTTERWIKFLAAAKQSGITLKDTETIFRSVTKASSVLGLQTEELQTIYLALEQMMSKGKVTTEELRRQLGEKLPGAVGIMAAAVGVSVEELDKMLKKGEVLSAEVLPKFARALESAYGIEAIENIDTLTAAQNRLTNAWELFVKSISEGKGVIAGAINFLSQSMQGWLMLLTPNSVLEQQKYDQQVIASKKEFTKQFIIDAKERLDATLANGKKYDDIDKQTKQAILDYRNAIAMGNKSEVAGLHKVLQEKIQLRQSYDEKIDADLQATATNRLKIAQNAFDAETKVLAFYQEKATKARQKGSFDVINVEADKYNKLAAISRKRLAQAEAELVVTRLNAEVPLPFVPEEEEKKPKRVSTKYLDNIKDLTNEEKILRLKSEEEINKAILSKDEISQEERSKLMLDNSQKRIDIADTQYKEAIEKAKEYYDKEKSELEIAIAKGSKIVGDRDKYLKDLDKNFKDQQLIANTNHNKALLDNEKQFDKDLEQLNKIAEDNKIRAVNDVANKQIITAKRVYEESKKTAKDKAALDKALNDIAIEQANAVIDVQIETLENMAAMSGISKEVFDQIQSLILKLKAAKKEAGVEAESDRKKLIEILEFSSRAADEIGALGDAIFDRKLENINAEIKAEEEKYDRLIDLAKNNKDEQERLQVEKEAKIRELEEKRLKQEQRKARFDKANALVQIALNTAIAISKVLGQTGIFGLAAWIPVAALGAVQAATVLAQPIPQYEQGLKNAPKDHVGIINDGKDQEFIERGNSILTTKTRNAIINLKKGDTIYKSYDDMVQGSDMFKNLSRSILLSNLAKINNDQAVTMEIMMADQLKNMQKDIKKGIHDGFNKVTINNVTKVDMNWLKYKNDTL